MKWNPKLPAHHQAWLDAHPEKTEEWLRSIIKQGFEIHHGDSVHENNHPDNLFLIERSDHQRLHGMFGLGWRVLYKKTRRPPEPTQILDPATPQQETQAPAATIAKPPFVHPRQQEGEYFLGNWYMETFQLCRHKTKRRDGGPYGSAPCFAQMSEIKEVIERLDQDVAERRATRGRVKRA